MASERRPGGLTALAVINFILGGLSLLGALGMMVLIPLMGTIETADMPEAQRAQIEAFSEVNSGLFITLGVISLVSAVLLILSGIGYLQLKKFLGRTLGNAYGVLGILSGLGTALMLPVALGGGFNIGAIIGFIYPVVTLILLNTTFKEDFVN